MLATLTLFDTRSHCVAHDDRVLLGIGVRGPRLRFRGERLEAAVQLLRSLVVVARVLGATAWHDIALPRGTLVRLES